jgi:predicted lipoprotein with Yx(FWY)xxD motif
MTRSRPITFLAGASVVPLAALAVAACGSSGTGGGATAATPPSTSTSSPKAARTHTARVAVAHGSLGKILVDSTGRTLYLFKADSSRTSACSGACAVAWPPLRTGGTPTAGVGVAASKLGTISRSGGNRQVTYNGHPLYLFIKDHKTGDVRGQGVTAFGAAWFAVSPAGNEISRKPARPGATAKPIPPAAKPAPANGIPQNNGGDGDADNNGGPSDGDGNI